MARHVTITCDNCGERQPDGASMYAVARFVIVIAPDPSEARLTFQRPRPRHEERFAPIVMNEQTTLHEICGPCALAASEAMTPALLARRAKGATACALA